MNIVVKVTHTNALYWEKSLAKMCSLVKTAYKNALNRKKSHKNVEELS